MARLALRNKDARWKGAGERRRASPVPVSAVDSPPKRLTAAERASVWAKYDGCCAYCGCALPDRWHVDHLKPVRRRT